MQHIAGFLSKELSRGAKKLFNPFVGGGFCYWRPLDWPNLAEFSKYFADRNKMLNHIADEFQKCLCEEAAANPLRGRACDDPGIGVTTKSVKLRIVRRKGEEDNLIIFSQNQDGCDRMHDIFGERLFRAMPDKVAERQAERDQKHRRSLEFFADLFGHVGEKREQYIAHYLKESQKTA